MGYRAVRSEHTYFCCATLFCCVCAVLAHVLTYCLSVYSRKAFPLTSNDVAIEGMSFSVPNSVSVPTVIQVHRANVQVSKQNKTPTFLSTIWRKKINPKSGTRVCSQWVTWIILDLFSTNTAGTSSIHTAYEHEERFHITGQLTSSSPQPSLRFNKLLYFRFNKLLSGFLKVERHECSVFHACSSGVCIWSLPEWLLCFGTCTFLNIQ